ncbi:MAG: Clp protease N-terminal domain-containing protein [Solirubrobacteraceae bacterium]
MVLVPEVDQLAAEISAGSPLERLAAASTLASRLRSRGDQLLDHFVADARAQGLSWSEIGDVLGTTKQAAHQRFAALADPAPDQAPFGLTGAAEEVLRAAEREARAFGHHYLRPEHVVVGLLTLPEEMAAIALTELGVTEAAVRGALVARLGRADPRPGGSLGVAPQTKRLFELARATGKTLCHNCPRTEHILLAAVSPKLQSPAATLLAATGASPAAVRDHVTHALLKERPELATSMHRSLQISRFWKSRYEKI